MSSIFAFICCRVGEYRSWLECHIIRSAVVERGCDDEDNDGARGAGRTTPTLATVVVILFLLLSRVLRVKSACQSSLQ